jgi:non-specific serine/threonine protein kinase
MMALTEALDDPWLRAFTLFAGSMITLVLGDALEAKRLAEANLEISEEIGDQIYTTMPLFVLGHAALASGELEGARAYYLRSLKMSREIGFHYAIQTTTKYLGKVTLSLGYLDEAEKYLKQSLQITREIGFLRDILNLLVEFARLSMIHEEPEAAVELLSFVAQHPVSSQVRLLEGAIVDTAEELLADLEGELDPDSFDQALARGGGLDLDETVADLISG